MKKLLVSLLFICSFLSLHAQFRFGIHGGANLSNMFVSDVPLAGSFEAKPSLNYNFGITPVFAFGKKWEISAPIQYMTKGFKGTEHVQGYLQGRERLHYLEIAPHLTFRPNNSIAGFNLGFYTGYLLEHEYHTMSSGWIKPAEGWYNDLDLGVLGGLKLYLGRLFFQANYQLGITPARTDQFTDVNGDPLFKMKFRNSNVQLSAGYMLFQKG